MALLVLYIIWCSNTDQERWEEFTPTYGNTPCGVSNLPSMLARRLGCIPHSYSSLTHLAGWGTVKDGLSILLAP